MNSRDIWNKICFHLSEDIKTDMLEDKFQIKVEQSLEFLLGWEKRLKDFESQFKIQYGSTVKRGDIMVKSNENPLFIIDVKRPKEPLTKGNQGQVYDYLRHLKLNYGILIGSKIQILYDGLSNKKTEPILLDEIKFEKDNEKGIRFVELFSKVNFNKDALDRFKNECFLKFDKERKSKELVNKVVSEEFKEIICQLIREELSKNFEVDMIDSVLDEIKIEVSRKNYPKKISTQSSVEISRRNEGEEKIGAYVKRTFKELVDDNLISEEEVERLKSKDYSRPTFRISYSFLTEEPNENYWKTPYPIHGKRYYVCSEWACNTILKKENKTIGEVKKERYKDWLEKMKSKN